MSMKTLFVTTVGLLLLLASTGFAQTPIPQATVAASASATVAASVTPAATPPEQNDLASRIHRRVDQKLGQKGLHFSIGDDEDILGGKGGHSDDVPEAVIPLIGIIFTTVFGAPVLIVAVIMYFGFSRNRMMHKTIRLMVEKGQPVPPALLAPPPPAVRQRSDMRRGVVLVMIGLALMLFFGAVKSWQGGAWAIGIIPFVIGVGYLLVWKLEGGQKPGPDNPPPLP
jgi:hypothetical protein